MRAKEFFMLDSKKIICIIILLALSSIPGFIPPLTSTVCFQKACAVEIGMPLKYLSMNWGIDTPTAPEFDFLNLLIDIIIFYLVVSILFYPFRRSKNVPNSNN